MKKESADTVLIVDDNEIDIFINRKVIEFSNFSKQTICAQSGGEALKLLKSEHLRPDLILLDLNMPIMDGFKFLFEFAQLPEDLQKEIKIVVLTSSDNARDKEKAAANPHVTAFISKPLNEEKLEKLRASHFVSRSNTKSV